MNKDVMAEIAQLEDFDEQLYKISGKTDDPEGSTEKYLIATSEQPICAFHKGDWMDPKELPLRYAGISTCFRKEAGSSGKDIRGIFRVHQFDKIEQFCITPDDYEVSSAEQRRMLDTAKEFYDSLGIGYRVVVIVSGALNDAAVKKYDLEGWFPGQNAYRELVSCSNCTDYQSRGVGVRCGHGTTATASHDLAARASYVHMLNATLCATGRGICCILETHQTDDGVVVPTVLRPYMGGKEFLPFVRGPPELSKGEKGAKKGTVK
jgi:seryl-tRNA synthetase